MTESENENKKENESKDIDELFNQIEEYAKMDHERNAKFRRRLVFLLPYNLALIYGTIKYSKNIHRISKFLWPNRRKFTIGNFLLIGTIQALFFTSLYAGGNMLILGINPLKPQESFKEDSEFVQGSSSIVIMKALKYVGLSDETLKAIEDDLLKASKVQETNGEQTIPTDNQTNDNDFNQVIADEYNENKKLT